MSRGARAREEREGHGSVSPARDPDLERLAGLVKAYAPHDGSFPLRIPGVHAIRRSHRYDAVVHGLMQPSLCIVAQGEKSVIVGRDLYSYEPGRMIAYSVDVPVAAQVTRASPAEPYLCLRLELDPATVAGLVLRVFPDGLPPVRESSAVHVCQADQRIIGAAVRLLELPGRPGETELLAPLVLEEILIRLLRSPIGVPVAQIGTSGSGVYGVARAASWLRANYAQPMKVEELARRAGMWVT